MYISKEIINSSKLLIKDTYPSNNVEKNNHTLVISNSTIIYGMFSLRMKMDVI